MNNYSFGDFPSEYLIRRECKGLEYEKKTGNIIRTYCSAENITQKYQLSMVSDVGTISWPKDSRKYDLYINEEGMYELLFKELTIQILVHKKNSYQKRVINMTSTFDTSDKIEILEDIYNQRWFNLDHLGRIIRIKNISKCIPRNEIKIADSSYTPPEHVNPFDAFISINAVKIIILRIIMKSFDGEWMIEKFPIGKHHIDLYFPDYNLAIEFDKFEHKDYKVKHQKFIEEKLQCKFIRFNLLDRKFNILRILNKIFLAIRDSNDSSNPEPFSFQRILCSLRNLASGLYSFFSSS